MVIFRSELYSYSHVFTGPIVLGHSASSTFEAIKGYSARISNRGNLVYAKISQNKKNMKFGLIPPTRDARQLPYQLSEQTLCID